MDWEKLQEKFDAIPEGTILRSQSGNYYLKPEQSIAHHLDYMVIDLFSGRIVHYSNLLDFEETSGNQIMW